MNTVHINTITPGNTGLVGVNYSRYKYGSVAMIEGFGAELATLALAAVPGILSEPVTITAPASRSVPIGADLLADRVLAGVNLARIAAELEPAVRAKLHRHTLPSGDYGGQSAAERRASLASERISLIPGLITGRHVVVVDDLWVTGASAEVTIAAVNRHQPRSLTYVLIGRVEPDYAAAHPQVERELNHAKVRDLGTLGEMLLTEPVAITQRLCKFALSWPGEVLRNFLANMQEKFVWQLYAAILADGLGLMPVYRSQFLALCELVNDNKLHIQATTEGWMP